MLKKLISKLNMKAGTFITMSALFFSVVAQTLDVCAFIINLKCLKRLRICGNE